MPDEVRSVQIKMQYPGSSLPSATQTFDLTREKPTASFFTYTGSSDTPRPYVYTLAYNMADGQRMELPEENAQAETLTIPGPFEQTLTTRFLAQADFNVVQKILVDARYVDAANDFRKEHHAELANNGDTSAWAFGLPNPNKRDFEYDVLTVFKNGAQEQRPDQKRQLGGTVPVGPGAVDALEVTVVASLLDWTKYKLVVLFLSYEDMANSIHEEKNFTLRKDDSDDKQWKVLLKDSQKKTYKYRARYFGVDSANNHEDDWKTMTDPVLVLE
jgi:hypothetical protein